MTKLQTLIENIFEVSALISSIEVLDSLDVIAYHADDRTEDLSKAEAFKFIETLADHADELGQMALNASDEEKERELLNKLQIVSSIRYAFSSLHTGLSDVYLDVALKQIELVKGC